MNSEPGRDLLAKGKALLVSDDAVSSSFVAAAGGEDQTEPGCKGRNHWALLQRLEAVIQKNVPDSILMLTPFTDGRGRDGIGELMPLRKNRPFLSEAKGPASPL